MIYIVVLKTTIVACAGAGRRFARLVGWLVVVVEEDKARRLNCLYQGERRLLTTRSPDSLFLLPRRRLNQTCRIVADDYNMCTSFIFVTQGTLVVGGWEWETPKSIRFGFVEGGRWCRRV